MAILMQKETSAEQILFSWCPKGRRAIVVTAILRSVYRTSCDITALIGTYSDMLLLLKNLFPEFQSQWQRGTWLLFLWLDKENLIFPENPKLHCSFPSL